MKHLSSLFLVLLGLSAVTCGDAKRGGGPAVDSHPDASTGEGSAKEPDAAGSGDVKTDFACSDCSAGAQFKFDACLNKKPTAELRALLQLAVVTEASVHELITCGALTLQVAIELSTGLVAMVIDPRGELLPNALKYQGDGLYRSGNNAGTMMDVWLFEEIGGDLRLIQDDLFSRDSYLVGANTKVEGGGVSFDPKNPLGSSVDTDTKFTVSFTGPGPWVRLSGLGDPPPNPIVLSLNNLASVKPKLGTIRVQSDVVVDEQRGDVSIRYHVKTPILKLSDLVSFERVKFDVLELDAKDGDGETLEMTAWDLEYSGAHTLDGSLAFSVTGGAFDYGGAFSFDRSASPTYDLRCE